MNGLWNTISGIDIDGDYTQSVIASRVDGDVTQNQYRFMRGQPAMYLSRAEVERRVACYVPAGNHDEVVRLLLNSHAVVLTGHTGAGRSTAAIAAMNELVHDIRIRRFVLHKEDVEEIGHSGVAGYIVRAADSDPGQLESCVEAVRASGGYLAVIEDDNEPAAASLPRIRIEPPPPLPVYRRWVAAHHRLPSWASWRQAAILLRDAMPADARRLADLVARVNEKGGSLEECQEEAAQAYLGWDDKLRSWFEKCGHARDRALLIAAASVPSGASTGYVYAAAALLAEVLRVDNSGGGLAWYPATGLRTLLDASPDGDTIDFHRVGFPRAVLEHALTDYPLAGTDVLTWLSQLPASAAGEFNKANEVTEIFAALAADHGAAELVTKAARRWGEKDLANLAFIALSGTSLHPRIGGRVRNALYDWSRVKNLPQTLKLVIAQVCGLVGEEYPSVALTRLKHLATRGNQEVLREVVDTSMAVADAGHREVVTAAAVQWCRANTGEENLSVAGRRKRRRAGAMLFLELAQTNAASASLRDIDQAWRAVFEFLPAISVSYLDAVEAAILFWLDDALSRDSVRERICTLFVDAARPTGATASRLADETIARAVIDVVQRWAAGDRGDITRTSMERLIVVPLSRPWWLRLARRLILDLRGYRQARDLRSQ